MNDEKPMKVQVDFISFAEEIVTVDSDNQDVIIKVHDKLGDFKEKGKVNL